MPDGMFLHGTPEGMLGLDMDELLELPELADVLKQTGQAYIEYLNRADIGDALIEVAHNLQAAQKRLWMPDVTQIAADIPVEADFGDAANDPTVDAVESSPVAQVLEV